jgi:hypothetical protein
MSSGCSPSFKKNSVQFATVPAGAFGGFFWEDHMRRAYGVNPDYDLEDRERMTQTALSRIWQIGPVATFQECRELAKLISAKLCESAPEQFDNVLAAEEVRPLLERAAAVLKKL